MDRKWGKKKSFQQTGWDDLQSVWKVNLKSTGKIMNYLIIEGSLDFEVKITGINWKT